MAKDSIYSKQVVPAAGKVLFLFKLFVHGLKAIFLISGKRHGGHVKFDNIQFQTQYEKTNETYVLIVTVCTADFLTSSEERMGC